MNSHQSSRRDGGRDWNGASQQQQQQQQQPPQPNMNYSSIHDAFQSRPTQSHQQQGVSPDIVAGRHTTRHDPSDMSSANVAYNYNVSSPPSRFFSPPPSSSQTTFGAMGGGGSSSSSAFPRAVSQGSFTHAPVSAGGFGSSQHSPPYGMEGDERMRFRDPPPHGFVGSGIEATTRVG